MKGVLVHGPVPPELEALIQRRQTLGQDRFDEVWKGVYHMTRGPSGAHAYLLHALTVLLNTYAGAAGLIGTTGFNLGSGPDDYRVPDAGYHRTMPKGVWIPTAAIVVEIVSPNDETFAKFDFFAHCQVEELLIVDPAKQTVTFYGQRDTLVGDYWVTPTSKLLAVSSEVLSGAINWPDA